jgi:hypothetical protein
MATDSEASEGDDQASVDMSAEDAVKLDGLEGDANAKSINKSTKAMFNMESNPAVEVNKKEEDEKLKKDVVGDTNGKSNTIKVTGHLSSGR